MIEPFRDSEEVRRQRAEEWRRFRRDNLFSQRRFCEVLGIARRTLQQIEMARITPHPATLRKFMLYRIKIERNRDRYGTGKGESLNA